MVEDYRKNTGKDLRKVAGRGRCPWQKPAYLGIVFSRSFHPEGENHEDASCCRHSCDGAHSPRSGEGEAGRNRRVRNRHPSKAIRRRSDPAITTATL